MSKKNPAICYKMENKDNFISLSFLTVSNHQRKCLMASR